MANPRYDMDYVGNPAGDAAIRRALTGVGQLVAHPGHILIEALGLAPPATTLNQVTIDVIGLLLLNADPAVAAGSAHFCIRLTRISTLLTQAVAVGGMRGGLRPGGDVGGHFATRGAVRHWTSLSAN